jgi:hypothetical protein
VAEPRKPGSEPKPGVNAPEVPRVPPPGPELPGRTGAPPGREIPGIPRPEPEVPRTPAKPEAPPFDSAPRSLP